MKLLFAIKGLHSNIGGAERVLVTIVNGLAANGHDITLVTYDEHWSQPFYALHKRVKRFHIGIGRADRKAGLFETLRRMIALRRIALRERPDAVVAFMHSLFIPMAFALAGTGFPLIASEHIVRQHYASRPFEYALFLASRFFVRKITVISESAKSGYPAALRKLMVVIPNPVALASEDDLKSKRQEPLILNVGRLEPQKDQTILIAAFARLADRFPDWSLEIIGKGGLRADLRRQIDESGFAARIHLIESSSDMASFYRRAAIFALPSSYESFGLATAEAMSWEVAPLGFADCPGTNEIIAHERSGLLALPGRRVETFTAALERLMESEDLRRTLSREARRSVLHFQADAVVKRWEDLLREIQRGVLNS